MGGSPTSPQSQRGVSFTRPSLTDKYLGSYSLEEQTHTGTETTEAHYGGYWRRLRPKYLEGVKRLQTREAGSLKEKHCLCLIPLSPAAQGC